MDDLSDPFAGTSYRTLGILGAGASARVYEVEHRTIHKRLVAKLLHLSFAEDPQVVERMLKEGRALASVQHPNLVEVVDFSYTDDGIPYLIMERLAGTDLRQALKETGPMPLKRALRYATQALSALHAAHSADIIHRDVKPENLFLHRLPSGRQAIKVLDLGLAKARELSERKPLGESEYPTEEGALVGTPHYMAPEQISNGEVDGRTDVYAMGCVLYELVTGVPPFDRHKTAPDILQAHLLEAPVPPSKRARRHALRVVDGLVLKALAKNQRDRYESAEEFEIAIRRTEVALRRALIPSLFLISAVVAASVTSALLWSMLPIR
jgi:serine/threonine protein kinase